MKTLEHQESICESAGKLADESANKSADESADESANESADESASEPADDESEERKTAKKRQTGERAIPRPSVEGNFQGFGECVILKTSAMLIMSVL